MERGSRRTERIRDGDHFKGGMWQFRDGLSSPREHRRVD